MGRSVEDIITEVTGSPPPPRQKSVRDILNEFEQQQPRPAPAFPDRYAAPGPQLAQGTPRPSPGVRSIIDSVQAPNRQAPSSRVSDIIAEAARSHGADEEPTRWGDIKDVFGEGVTALSEARRRERERAPSSAFMNPLRSRAGQEGGLGEFLSIVGGAFNTALAPILGLKRYYVDRPLSGALEPGELESRRWEDLSPSERATRSARYPFSGPAGDPHRVEPVTTLAIPGLGVVPYARMAGAAGRAVAASPLARLPRLFQRPPDPLKTFTTAVADDLFRLRQTGTADRAELRSRVAAMPPETRTSEVQEIVHNLIEIPSHQASRLPPAQLQALNNPATLSAVATAARILMPLRLELSNLYSRLRKLGIPDTDLVDPNYVHRRAVGHDYTLDPSVSGISPNPVMGIQRTLPRTTSALQPRKYLGGVARDGSRVVVSESPAGVLEAHTGAATTSPVRPHPSSPDHFILNGKAYRVEQATAVEIERATAAEPRPVTYYKNALANTVDALARMRAVARHVEWLDALKKSPEFQTWGTQRADVARRLGWTQSKLPQLEGWFLHPRLRGAFDDFYRPGMGSSEALEAFRKVNQFATASMFWNPTPHIENVLGHWIVGRGFDWVKPQGVRSLFQDGARAIRAVTTLNSDYQRLLKAGSGMVFGGVRNADFYREVAKLAGMDVPRNLPRWDPVARTLGISTADLVKTFYGGMSRVLWWANDIFMMQRVLELERKGMPLKAAIREAEKHIPNYRIPTEVLGSRVFSQILQEPAFTVFSRYHYGVFNSYANMVRDLVAGKTGAERLDAIGNMMALGLLTWVAYPALDAAFQNLTGDDTAGKQRRGPATIPHAVQEMFEGDRAWPSVVSSAITIPGATRLGFTLAAGGHDPFTGQPVTEPGSSFGEQAAQLGDYAGGQLVQPWQLVNRNIREAAGKGANTIGREILNQAAGLKDTSDNAEMARRRAKLMEQRRAGKRERHPRGVLESIYGGTD